MFLSNKTEESEALLAEKTVFTNALWFAVVAVATLFAGVFGTMILFQALSTKSKNRLLFMIGSWFLRIGTLMMEKTIFVLDYFGGFNLHFETSAAALREYLPNHLEPIPMKTIEGVNDEESKYIVSLYTAEIHMEGNNIVSESPLARSDIFTYVRDAEGKTGLCFICALVKPPKSTILARLTEQLNLFFGMCPQTFDVAYPHYETEVISVSNKHYEMKRKTAKIEVFSEKTPVLSRNKRLSNEFVIANSQIYRGSKGTKNTNFFNGDFIDASVTCWDPSKVYIKNPTDLHPLCQKLVGVESYEGKNGKPIRWYFENH